MITFKFFKFHFNIIDAHEGGGVKEGAPHVPPQIKKKTGS